MCEFPSQVQLQLYASVNSFKQSTDKTELTSDCYARYALFYGAVKITALVNMYRKGWRTVRMSEI